MEYITQHREQILSDNGATIITGQYYPFTSPLLSISYNYGANWSTVIQLKRRVASPTTATHPLVSCSSDCTKIVAVLQVVDSYNEPINSSVWGSTNGGHRINSASPSFSYAPVVI
jgi:hypothetical protein